MAVIKLTLLPVNTTDYLIVNARKVSDPTVIAASRSFTPGELATGGNVIIPFVGVLDPTNYYLDFRRSPDGVAQGVLQGIMEYDVKKQIPLSETLHYQAGGLRAVDPAVGQTDLIDPYLDGKNITQVLKEGYPLTPPAYTFKKYDLIAGGGIRLLNGQVFNTDEVMIITITYSSFFDQEINNSGLYDSTVLISTDTTLNTTHRNKRLKCEALSSRLIITMEDLATVPTGKFYQFTCNDGTQKKVRILAHSGNIIKLGAVNVTEISIGLGESVRLEKYTDGVTPYWDVINPSPGITQVGEFIHKGSINALNALQADGYYTYDGDDEPRIWAYILSLPSTHVIVDDAVINALYVHPAGQEGMYVRHTTAKKFRTPNTRDWVFKGLHNYNDASYNTDTTNRPIDYPGGTELNKVGEHYHLTFFENGTTNLGAPLTATNWAVKRQGSGAGIGSTSAEYNMTGGPDEPNVGRTSRVNVGVKNKVNNIGTVYLIRS